jgi:hypothetical protein
MSKKLPAFQFYPADWRKDPSVQALSYEEKGVWFEILCIMHESDERGKLLLNGKKMPETALARLLGLDNQKVKQILTTLIDFGCARVEPETGVIYSKRMVKDEHIRMIRKEAGKKGGNPGLVKQKATTQVKQKPTPSSSSSSSSSDKHSKGKQIKEEDPQPKRQLIATLAALGFQVTQVHTPKVVGLIAHWETAGLTPEELTNLVESLRQRDPNKTFGPAYLEQPVKSYLETRNGQGNTSRNQGNGSGKNKHQIAADLIQADIERCFGTGSSIDGIHGEDEADIPGEVDGEVIHH